jgi:antitoxin component YwqK of YwqJK toxin-antitoxin module
MTSQYCKAITESNNLCCRNAVIDGYCTQHHKMNGKNKDEQSQELPPELMRYGVSDYIEYDELKNLEKDIDNLRINPNRMRIVKYDEVSKYGGKQRIVDTIIDDVVRDKKIYSKNKLILHNIYDENGKDLTYTMYDRNEIISTRLTLDGKDFLKKVESFYPDGKIAKLGHHNGKERHGEYTEWYDNGNMKMTVNYINGKKEGVEKRWSNDGHLFSDVYYKDDKLVK